MWEQTEWIGQIWMCSIFKFLCIRICMHGNVFACAYAKVCMCVLLSFNWHSIVYNRYCCYNNCNLSRVRRTSTLFLHIMNRIKFWALIVLVLLHTKFLFIPTFLWLCNFSPENYTSDPKFRRFTTSMPLNFGFVRSLPDFTLIKKP